MFKIYKRTAPSGNYYIGLTGTEEKERWRLHVSKAMNTDKNHPLLNAIRKYGGDSFTVEILHITESIEEARSLEIERIAESPEEKSYNISPGGEYDSGAGRKSFWNRMRNDPIACAEYLKKLSDTKKANDWSDYEYLAERNAQWRKDNPKLAWKIGYRNLRLANKANREKFGEPKPKIELSLKERLRRKFKMNEVRSEYVTEVWASRTEQEKQEIFSKIGETNSQLWSLITDPKERNAKTQAARDACNHIERAKAASKGLKAWWEELRKDPIAYREYLDNRKTTWRKNYEAKKNV